MKLERLIIKIKAYQETTSIEAQKYFGSIKFRDIKVVLEIWIPNMLGRNLRVRKSVLTQFITIVEISSINKCKSPNMRQMNFLL
jgi:hypothetical protein